MFRRRHKPHIFRRIREVFWPKSGWIRAGRYVLYRVLRLKGTPYSVAAGFACGAAISFTPFLGFHFLLSAAFAWSIGGNVIASAIGTVVGNPWTFPLIWTSTFEIGHWLLGTQTALDLPDKLTFAYILDRPSRVLLPMAVGGLIEGVVAWWGFYWPLRRLVAGYQARRRRLREGRGPERPEGRREART